MLIVFRDASLFGNRSLKRIIRTVREDCHDSTAHGFDDKPLEGSDDQTDLFIMAIYKIYEAYISLDKPAVRDANDTVMKKNRNAKSGKRKMNEEY